MKVKGKVVVSDVYTSEKATYYSVVDLDAGGTFSFTLDGGGALQDVKPGAMLDVDGVLKLNRVGSRTFLTMLDGTFGKLA